MTIRPGVDYNACEDEDYDDVNNSDEDEDNDVPFYMFYIFF